MKKYFIHDGDQEIGPLSIEELKSKDITRSTKVWYEGLEEWKSADSLDDLKVLFTSIPPPLRSDNKLSAPPPIKKKKSIGKIIVWFLVGIVIAGVALVFINNPNAVPGVKILVNTPKPIVVTSRADDTGTDLFKQRLTVYGTIQNQGGDGNVYVTFHAFQDGKDFKRTQQLFLRANQSEDAQATFDEVTRLGGDITYNIEVKSE